jgi:hypothetical protein
LLSYSLLVKKLHSHIEKNPGISNWQLPCKSIIKYNNIMSVTPVKPHVTRTLTLYNQTYIMRPPLWQRKRGLMRWPLKRGSNLMKFSMTAYSLLVKKLHSHIEKNPGISNWQLPCKWYIVNDTTMVILPYTVKHVHNSRSTTSTLYWP